MQFNKLYGKVVNGNFDQQTLGTIFQVYLKEEGQHPANDQELEAYQLPVGYVEVQTQELSEPQPPLQRYENFYPQPVELIDGVWTLTYGRRFLPEEEIMLAEKQAGISIRYERSLELSASDWTQLPDSPLSAEKKAEWALFRQAWRDITLDPNYPHITRPVKPSR